MKCTRPLLLLLFSLIASSAAAQSNFAPAVAYNAGAVRPSSVAVADVNRDGKPDLVVANLCVDINCVTNGIVSVLLGNGDGTFQTAVTYNSGGYGAVSIVVADVNGDGKPDILVANRCAVFISCGGTSGGHPDSNGIVSVLLGNGDGTFQPAVTYNSGGLFTTSIAVGDVNGDGKPDLVVSNPCGVTNCFPQLDGAVGVLLGNGDGTFQTAVNYDSGGRSPGSVAVADVNGDGRVSYDELAG